MFMSGRCLRTILREIIVCAEQLSNLLLLSTPLTSRLYLSIFILLYINGQELQLYGHV